MPRALHNANFIAPDEDGFAFAVISTSAFIAWQRMVGGALESRLRFSNTMVWNTLPLPELSEAERGELIQAGVGVLVDVGRHHAELAARHEHARALLEHGAQRLDEIDIARRAPQVVRAAAVVGGISNCG